MLNKRRNIGINIWSNFILITTYFVIRKSTDLSDDLQLKHAPIIVTNHNIYHFVFADRNNMLSLFGILRTG